MSRYIGLILFVLYPYMSFAASFDCRRAATETEKLICNDPQLSRSDEEMAASYRHALKAASDPAVIKKQQREWLAAVQHCSDASCLKDAYASRMAQLAYPEDGIWTGTIGKQQVMACFAHYADPENTNYSGYYFLRNSRFVALIPRTGGTNNWYEDSLKDPTGIWTITDRNADKLYGNWSDPAGKHTAPIRLTRFKTLSRGDTSAYNFRCDPEDNVFDAAIFARIQNDKISSGEVLTHDGRRYRSLSALGGAVSSLELIDKTEASVALNERLKHELQAEMANYHGCRTRTDGKDAAQTAPDYTTGIEPVFWNERWITFLQRTSGYCGGAYPFSGFSYTTWDLTSGKKIILDTWLDQSESSRSRLNKIIAGKAVKQRLALYPQEAREENNCLAVIRENTTYELSLRKKGMVFSSTFPHAMQACDDNIEIPYSELSPFLTQAGKEAVMYMLQPATLRK